MRFLVAIILIIIYSYTSLATRQTSFDNIGMLIGYLLGAVILAPSIIASLFCIPKSGRNNKRFFRVFNIVLLFGILINTSKFAELNGPPKTFTGSNGIIQMTAPASWLTKKTDKKNVQFYFTNRAGNLEIIVSYDNTSFNDLSLRQFARLSGNRLQKNVPDFKSRSSLKRCISTTMQCVYQIIDTTNTDTGTTSILATLKGKHGYYNFYSITSPGLYGTYKNDIMNALQSLDEISPGRYPD